MSFHELTPEDVTTLRKLRAVGCAVTVFLPQELEDATPDDVEDAMCEAGWRQINFDSATKKD